MNAKRMILATALAAVSFARADDPVKLIYIGDDNGRWTAENVWSNAVTGAKSAWQDGAIAVIPGKSLEIPQDVSAHGLEVTSLPGELDLTTGAGKLTLGAGGLSAEVSGSWKNCYIKNAGGLHLAADQSWKLAFTGMFQIGNNNNCPLTAEPNVTWTIGGRVQLRGAAAGGLTSDVTMIVGDSVLLALDSNTVYGFGKPKLVLEGPKVKTDFGNNLQSSVLGGNCASAVTLRSGAALTFNAENTGYFEAPELKVDGDGDAKLSCFTGGVVRLAPGATVVDVADGHALVLDAALAKTSPSTKLVKRGAGTLTVAQSAEPIDVTVEAGTLQFASRKWKHFRFKIDAVYNPMAWGVQISEFKLLDGDTAVAGGTASYDKSTVILPSGTTGTRTDCWEHETPAKALDGNLNTKWVDQRVAADQIASKGDKVWVQVSYDEPVRITGYSWATANDADPDDSRQSCRDPSAWRLLASDDGENWVELDRRENMGPYAARKSWVGTFSVGSGLGADAQLGHVVVEAGGTLDLRGSAAPTSGSIENRGGTILTDAGAKTEKAVAVLGGTLSRGPATFGGKFFRVTLMGNRVSGWDCTSIAEFSLYAADGTRVNQGTFTNKSASVAAVNDLAAGEVWLDANGGNVREKVVNAFDGNTETMFFVSGVKPSSNKTIVFAFRLPDDAARVAGYTFTTGLDAWDNQSWYHRNNPTDWKVEGSFDGQTWYVLDEVSVKATTPNAAGVEYNGGAPYAVTGWGEPGEGEEQAFDKETAVSVAPGATLELRSEKMVVGHLAVDCRTAGEAGGTITCLTPMPDGTLDLTVDDPESVREGFVVPLTIGKVVNAKNFASWTVRVNGVAKPKRKLIYRNGKLVINGFGFVLICR